MGIQYFLDAQYRYHTWYVLQALSAVPYHGRKTFHIGVIFLKFNNAFILLHIAILLHTRKWLQLQQLEQQKSGGVMQTHFSPSAPLKP